jgi:chromosome segregation ATPase
MTSEQFSMVAEAVDNNMSTSDIADMLGCSSGMVYDIFRTKVYQNAKRRYEKHKVKPVETKPELAVEPVVNGPAAHEAPTHSSATLEELNNKYRALETAYNSKLTELQQIKNDMDKTKEEIKKLQEKEEILKKVEELERQKKKLMEQLQTL